jgi:Uma2 family endonuclease
MPNIPTSDKHPLIARVLLEDLNGLQISANLHISKIYVINGNSIWISNPTDVDQDEKVSYNGPEWNTNIYVDVVVEIISTLNKSKYLLISQNEYIYRRE